MGKKCSKCGRSPANSKIDGKRFCNDCLNARFVSPDGTINFTNTGTSRISGVNIGHRR